MADEDEGNTDGADRDGIDWETCAEDGCIGIRLADTEDSKGSRLYPDCESGVRCWAHAEEAELEAALRHVSEHGNLDARGVTVTSDLLQRLLSTSPKDDEGHPVLNEACFDHATFEDEAHFRDVTFTNAASFDKTTFTSDANFAHAAFQCTAGFKGATFAHGALFVSTTFNGDAHFANATFLEGTWFPNATFHQDVSFSGVVFHGTVDFGNCEFHSRARFSDAAFHGDATFYSAALGDVELPESPLGRNATIDGASFRGNAEFVNTTFHSEAGFNSVEFHRTPEFVGADFHGEASFNDVTFHRDAELGRTTFQKNARFRKVTFQGSARFDHARFEGQVDFSQATFESAARFSYATFRRDASFDRVTFGGPVVLFNRTTFERSVSFHRAAIKDATFDRAVVGRDAWFRHTVFVGVKQLGPMLVRRSLVLDHAVLHQRVQVDVSAAILCARRARFLAGTHLRVRWAEIVLDDADLAHTSILSGEPSPFQEVDEGRWAKALGRLRRIQRVRRDPGRPRLMSLQRADVAGLTVASVDLRACRFVGAHNLDQLRVQESEYSLPPEGQRLVRRHTIAEEHHWRAQNSKTGRPSRRRSAWRRWRGQGDTHAPSDDAGRSSTEDSRVLPDPHGREARQAGSPTVSLAGTTSSQRSYATRSHNLRGRGERSGTPPDAPRIGDRRDGDRDWYGPAQQPPRWAEEVDVPTPAQVAAVYRDLRKGREDAKDEPGAAYFYYGEMEMRRHATSRHAHQSSSHPSRSGVGERLVLTLYWLLSGYGLRAKRALVALAAVILVTGVAFAFWGFAATEEPGVRAVAVDDEGAPVYELHEPERPAGLDELPNAIRFSAQSTAALLRDSGDVPLTPTGEWLHLGLRLVGPLLFGLAILAIRGRVKR